MVSSTIDGTDVQLANGLVGVAAITSCTNTSNLSVMVGCGLVAKKAVEKGLEPQAVGQTTLAPGSQVVSSYPRFIRFDRLPRRRSTSTWSATATSPASATRPLVPAVSRAANNNDIAVTAVLSGNRNFEGRINPDVKMNYLASPPLVVAYALAGTMDIDLTTDPIGQDPSGNDVFLRDIWPSPAEVEQVVSSAISAEMYSKSYADVFAGDERWQTLPTPEGDTFEWDDASTYVRKPPYFEGMPQEPAPVSDITGARVLLKLGDSVTTDHISPAGSIKADSPAGKYLTEHGVERKDFNSYGSRRGNHEVMIRGTFANIRLRNQIAPGTEGGFTRDFTVTDAPVTTVYDASTNYQPPASRWSCWLARSTARVARATGRRRAPCCWAFARSSPRATSASTAPT